MTIYGYDQYKNKTRLPTPYADVTDLFEGGSETDVTGISQVGNAMDNDGIAFFHVNNNGFPGSGKGTILAFKTSGGTYKNYMFFDTENDQLYFLAADGTSKTWKKLLTKQITYSQSIGVNANQQFSVNLASGLDSNTMFTLDVYANNDVYGYQPVTCQVGIDDSGKLVARGRNFGSYATTVNIKVHVIA